MYLCAPPKCGFREHGYLVVWVKRKGVEIRLKGIGVLWTSERFRVTMLRLQESTCENHSAHN